MPAEIRGTFAGLMRPEVIDYIRRLGVSAVELLPIHAFVDDSHLLDKKLRNFWGYSTIGFFAPQPRYLGTPFVTPLADSIFVPDGLVEKASSSLAAGSSFGVFELSSSIST